MKNISLKSLINESTDIRQFRNKPSDGWNETNIKLVLMRKIEGKTAVYRLETDDWFRRWEGVGKGSGIMIRNIRIASNPTKINSSWVSGPDNSVFKVVVEYLPNEFDHPDDDVKENYETAKGFIIMGNKFMSGFEMQQNISPKELEGYIKMNMKKYKP